MKRSYPLSRVYGLLEPGPVALITTSYRGRADIMAMSWYTMMEFEPPLVGCVISGRSLTFDILKKTRECVINIPTKEMMQETVGCGNTSGRTVDKFKTFKLTPSDAAFVKAPLVDECYANLECKVVDARMAARYNFFVLQVLKAWIDPSRKDPRTFHHRGKGMFMVAGRTIKVSSRMK